jgi:hypothetical protein
VSAQAAVAEQTSEPSTALTPIERAKVALNSPEHEKKLAELAKASVSITAITNAAGYTQCHSARMALKAMRVTIEKTGKEARSDATAFSKAVIAEEARLVAIISPEETRLEKIQKEWDDAREAERQAKIAAEKARIDAIHTRIDDIRQYPLDVVGKPSAEIELVLKTVVDLAIDESNFAELKQQAEGAKATTLIRLRAAHTNAVSMEAEQARLAAERAENERVRLANEAAAKAERERIAEAQRLENESLARERERIAEEERIAKETRDREAAEHRVRLAEQERVAKAARDAEEQRQAEARDLAEARLGEIQGIQHQVFIATTGRLGVRKGGTRECIVETLLETEGWEVSEEKFGPLLSMAREAKISAISQITEIRDRWDRRIAEAAERAEAERVEAERKAAADAEAQRLADERAQLERDQAALRAEREKPATPTTISEGADIREDSVRQARDTPCDALSRPVDEPAVESGSVAQVAEEPADPLLMTIRLTEWLPMQSVCKAAQEWAVFQDAGNKRGQKVDRQLAAQAREAASNLVAAVGLLP